MKTIDFIRRVKELRYDVCADDNLIAISSRRDKKYIAYIKKNIQYGLNIYEESQVSDELFGLISAYVATPVDDREEEYIIYHKYLVPDRGAENGYLHIADDGIFTLSSTITWHTNLDQPKYKDIVDNDDWVIVLWKEHPLFTN